MKKTIICLLSACLLHFSAFAMCHDVSLGEAILFYPVIVYAEISFEATTENVRQTTVGINVIQAIKGSLGENITAKWGVFGSRLGQTFEKASIKGIFFLSKNDKNEWFIGSIGCYSHRLILDNNNKIILDTNADDTDGIPEEARVTITDFKEGVALYLKSIKKSGKFKKNKKTQNETYKALAQNFRKVHYLTKKYFIEIKILCPPTN
jgi:hypothetical protein